MTTLHARLESLSPAQRDLLLKKIREHNHTKNSGRDTGRIPLVRVARQERMRLSLAQERMWFIEQLEDTHNAYAVATAGYIEGNLSRERLVQALELVVDRHEMLRTTFRESKGKPFQYISPESKVNYHYNDLRSLNALQQDTVQDYFITTLTNEPFDLTVGPLHRVGLVRLENERFLLLIVMHHIITDGWSLGIFFRDLTHCYNHLSEATEHTLPVLPIQYVDYAAWQQSQGSSGVFNTHIEYWKKCLEGAPPLLVLPLDMPRTSAGNGKGVTGSFVLSPHLTDRLRHLGKKTESSLFMVTLAGFAALLNRYSRQDDIVIGTPVANRKMLELEQLIGCFVNTLAVRIRFFDDLSVVSYLEQVRSVVLDAFSHEDAPFEHVVDACVKERNLDHSPLFQVMFAFQNAPMPDSTLGECSFTPIAVERNSTHFDLGFFLAEKDGGVEVTFEYRADLFTGDTIHQLCEQYRRLLEGMVESPASRLSGMRLLSQEERATLLRGNSDTSRQKTVESSVVTLFEQQCQKAGERIAVSGENESISYNDLNVRANRLAKTLRGKGVSRDTVVAVALDRSVDMIAAVVGILKAGGCCLPLDLSNPPARMGEIIADSGVGTLLTSSSIDNRYHFTRLLPRDSETDVLFVDDVAPFSEEEENLNSTPDLDYLAYVLYTSGSTGKPKGVAMPHRSLGNLVAWQHAQDGFAEPATTLQFSPLCFDVSFQEIFFTLCYGGTLILIDDHVRKDSGALLDVLDHFEVERLFMPFVALQQLAITAIKGARYPASLRELITAGEQLRITDPVRGFFTQLPKCRLHNQYGPTESHVVTSLTLPEDVATWPVLPSIGHPIDNCAIYILEKNMEPAPIGVPGELYIGGLVCARGYLNRPELTGERFLADPFRALPQARMYRSGDLARYLPDGSIECLGRVDHQVKIRGFRVELQEIESVLDCLEIVKECAVVVDENHVVQPELVAYIVGHQGCTTSSLRKALAEKLPSYMVPRYLVLVEAMPLTPNGKIDRQALLKMERDSIALERVEHSGKPIESILCEIWARVLGLPMVRVDDNFFEVGGHSLLATQLISEINDVFSLALPIRELFEYPTVAELADRIDSSENLEGDEFLQSGSQAATDPSLLSYAQERLWLVEQSLGVSAVYNMPVALECEGVVDMEALQEAIHSVVARHETLRTVFIQDKAGTPRKKVLETIDCAMTCHDLTTIDQESQKRSYIGQIVHEEANTPFDLESGPLIRGGRVAVGPDRHIILFTFHHIICDGWSIGVFARELSAFYQARISGTTPQIEPLVLQYHDFAVWQRRLLASERGDELRRYWQRQLVDVPHLLDITENSGDTTERGNTGELLSFSLDHDLCRELHDLSRAQASTLYMTLLSAFSWLIFLYSGQERFLLGTPIANRNRKQFEPLIGFFVNILPIKVELGGDPEFIDTLNHIRKTCLEAYTHQDMPFDEIVRLLNPERIPNRHPLVQVVFVLQNTPEPTLTLGDTRLTPIEREQTVAKYDLLLSLTQSNGEIHGALEYSTDLFSETAAQGLIDVYSRIITKVLNNPMARLLDPDISPNSSEEKQTDTAIDDIFFEF